MTYPAALEAFEAVTRRDPACALAYWGAGMTLFQPLWPNRPSPDELRRGWELMQEARRRVEPGGRESMFVAAGEAFFDPGGDPDYWLRIERWAAATAALHRSDPDDREASALQALALLATASRQGDAAAHHAEAARLLEEILEEEPTHPGAVHYTIHANDFRGRERTSLDVVRSYGEIAPDNAHALHMPTHIFVLLGRWNEVIDWNRRAAAAALAQRVGPSGAHVWDEFPHAVEYLVYAHLQRGDDVAAADLIRSLNETPDLQPSFKTAFHYASTSARYVVERRDWQAAAGTSVRVPATLAWDLFPWPEATAWFARGLGAAHTRAPGAVEESLARLRELSRRAADAGEPLFASQIDILRLELEGWQAFARGDRDTAVRRIEDAVSLEERTPKHPVTPGPTLPARELLGDLHLALGEPGPARDAYRASNDVAPGRLNTLLGLARASVALGEPEAARAYYAAILEGAAPSSTRAGVSEARAFIDGG
jgi:tetratricopeptide (TPR) repeat protein